MRLDLGDDDGDQQSAADFAEAGNGAARRKRNKLASHLTLGIAKNLTKKFGCRLIRHPVSCIAASRFELLFRINLNHRERMMASEAALLRALAKHKRRLAAARSQIATAEVEIAALTEQLVRDGVPMQQIGA